MQNFLDPAILFFLFGVLAALLKSNLEIPQPVSRFLSLYLLMALGLKGGFALGHAGLTREVGTSLGAAVALAVLVPAVGFLVLRRLLSEFDAAAVAATYGSVSAVTFVTATQYLESQQLAFGGHMAAAMALMESPAIVMAVLLANHVRMRARAAGGIVMQGAGSAAGSIVMQGVGSAAGSIVIQGAGSAALVAAPQPRGPSVGALLKESFTDGSQLLLLGAMVVGILSGDAGKAAMQPFTGDLFKGMLAFFLLDMGLVAARNMGQLGGRSPWLLAYAVAAPLAHAGVALVLASLLGLSAGNGALLMTLAASASYIAVPAALRHAMPEADPAIYLGLSLGVTFPLNITLGIPLYAQVARAVLG